MTSYVKWIKLMLWNLLILIAVILPMTLFVQWVTARLLGIETSGDFVGDASVLYVGFLGPLVAAGVIYLLALFSVANRAPSMRRGIAFGLIPVILIVWTLMGFGGLLVRPHFVIPFLLGLIVYAAVVRPLPVQGEGETPLAG